MNRLMSPVPITIAACLAFFACGWAVRDHFVQRERAQHDAARAQALADAMRNARAIEQTLTARMETLQHETEQKLVDVAAAERRAADERVRGIAAAYAARHRAAAADAAAARQCAAAAPAADVLAELLGDLDELAQGYAAEADRRRIAGLACESAYDGVRIASAQGDSP